jgi:hypothetical protein
MDVFDDLVEHLTMIAISLVRRAKESDGERPGGLLERSPPRPLQELKMKYSYCFKSS